MLPLLSRGQGGEVCFTIDDLPVVGYSQQTIAEHEEITAKLLESIKRNRIPAIGFVNEIKLYTEDAPDSLKIGLLRQWLENGLALGNHAYSHPNYHKVPFDDYTANILRGELITKPLAASYRQEYKYFRHPYLRIGQTIGAHDSLKQFLHAHGYSEAPVTIDNADYLFAAAYDKARVAGDPVLMKEIGERYIRYMEEMLLYYRQKSVQLFGRDIRHILLLHANALNADYLDGLAEMYRENHYSFVTLERALEDPAYQTPITAYGEWGISWIDRWAMSQGKKGDFFKDEPDVPELINEILR